MRDLTHKEFEAAPSKVAFLYISALLKQPVGGKMIDDAIKEYPEYFPDEIEHRKKWASVPEDVKEEYFSALSKMHEEVYKDMPPSKGIIGWIKDPKGYEEWNKAWQTFRPIEKQKEKEIHEKYLTPHGINYNSHE